MTDLKQKAAELIAACDEQFEIETIYEMLEIPPNADMGDIALPCFKLSKLMRKAPNQIAADIASSLKAGDVFSKIEALSGYVNFFADKKAYITDTLNAIIAKGESYGQENIGEGKTITMDYSAPNIAKPFHVGHLLTTVLGNSLYKIYSFMGYKVVGINHLGDWGTQFGKLIVAYKNWGDEQKVEEEQVKELVRLYVKFHEEAEKDESLNDEARGWFTRLENGDAEAHALWKWFVDISLLEFKKIYDLLDIEFDSYHGESFYNDKMQPIISELKEKKMLEESNGAMIVDLKAYDLSACLLLKNDGSSLYATRDIAAAFYRKKTYDFDKSLYIMGGSQSLHFNQWTKVVELMGYDWVKDCVHVPFGMISINGKKLATRTGNVILLEDVFNDAINRILELIKEKNQNMPNMEQTAKDIGVGAIVFGFLLSNRNKDISFNYESALNFDGETGPYVQYTHARACSLLEKSGIDVDRITIKDGLLDTNEEYEVSKLLAKFPDIIRHAMDTYEPSIITRYLIDAAQAFNKFYHECPILVEDMELRTARIALTNAVRVTLKNGLYLIGLKAPNKV